MYIQKIRDFSTPYRVAAMVGLMLTIVLSAVVFSTARAQNNGTVATVVISSDSMQSWFFHDDEHVPPGNGELVVGPETPPMGLGSVHLTLGELTAGMTIQLIDFRATPLADIDTLEYSTYVKPDSTVTVAIALQFNIDDDLTDGDNNWKGRLVFEPPYYGETAKVTKGEWQTWHPMEEEGKWWWGTRNPIKAECSISDPCTWDELLTNFPNIGIRDADYTGVLFKAGSGWAPPWDGNVDAFTIGINGNSITYDFENSKEDCKKGGWIASENPDFSNQGECVSYIASSGRVR